MIRWNGKHPIPWDFFNTFNNVSGKNLDWFWNSWFFNNYYIDLAIAKPVKSRNGYEITVNNIGGMAVPFEIAISYADNSIQGLHETAEIWKGNLRQAKINLASNKVIKAVEINGGIFMDADEANNSWKVR